MRTSINAWKLWVFDEEENMGFILEGEVDETINRYELCLVGRLLTEKGVNTKIMKSRIADIWRPFYGVKY